jgi:hypothetical protein
MDTEKSKEIISVRHHILEIPIFDRRVLITSAPISEWMSTAYAIVPAEDRDQLIELENACAWTFSNKLKHGDISVHAWILFSQTVTSPIIVHENVHVFEALMASCGIEEKDEELRAYFSDWLYWKVSDVVNEWGILDNINRR